VERAIVEKIIELAKKHNVKPDEKGFYTIRTWKSGKAVNAKVREVENGYELEYPNEPVISFHHSLPRLQVQEYKHVRFIEKERK
jgi:hypothetical protein